MRRRISCKSTPYFKFLVVPLVLLLICFAGTAGYSFGEGAVTGGNATLSVFFIAILTWLFYYNVMKLVLEKK